MDNLTYELRQLCNRNRDGGHTTQADRMRSLGLMARQLHEMGFRRMGAASLKQKHVRALLDHWQGKGLSAGTTKNYMAHLRWWAEKTGKTALLPNDNAALGIADRQYVTNVSKAKTLDGNLDRITDPYVSMSLRLQAGFGLRREEAIKFQPGYADRGDHISLKGSWCKGGKERSIPITEPEQRELLQTAHQLAGSGSLIPAHKSYKEQRQTYDGQCKAAGLKAMHGLRHQYAQARYEVLTGWKAPAAGGPSSKQLTPAQRVQDRQARLTISRELGHEREQITAVYLGR
ncbi:MAG: integrase domain-containing protein [Burkholderiaceae bacterium]|jgi:hypothetical protein|nr:integrase domain-containing protein [Burkholderiaceae bacterium]